MGLKNNKAAGPNSLPAEVLKYGGDAVVKFFHKLFSAVWSTGQAPSQCRDANIVGIYKKKDNCANCDNSRDTVKHHTT